MSYLKNPAAFPCSPGDVPFWNEGMDLRDYFAGQALPAVIVATSASQHVPVMCEGETHIRMAIARDAYEMADAMLAERAKGGAE